MKYKLKKNILRDQVKSANPLPLRHWSPASASQSREASALPSSICNLLQVPLRSKNDLHFSIGNNHFKGSIESVDASQLVCKLTTQSSRRLSAGMTLQVRFRSHGAKSEFLTSIISTSQRQRLILSLPTMIQRVDERSGHRQTFYTVEKLYCHLSEGRTNRIYSVIDVSSKGFALLLKKKTNLRIRQEITGFLTTAKDGEKYNIKAEIRHISPDPSRPNMVSIGCRLLPGSSLTHEALKTLVEHIGRPE